MGGLGGHGSCFSGQLSSWQPKSAAGGRAQVLKLCEDVYVPMPDPLGKTACPNLQPLQRQGLGQPCLTACGTHVPQPAGNLCKRPQVGWRA